MSDTASELYNDYLETYYDKHNKFSDAKKRELDHKCNSQILFLDNYNYSLWSENEEEFEDLPSIPPLGGDEEEVKKRKGLKILTPSKLLTRLPIFLAQIKAIKENMKWNQIYFISFVSVY